MATQTGNTSQMNEMAVASRGCSRTKMVHMR